MGRLAVFVQINGALSVYLSATGERLTLLDPSEVTNRAAFTAHPQEPLVAIVSYFHRAILVRNIRTGAIVCREVPPWIIGPPSRLPFNPGNRGVTTSRDGRVVAQAMWNGYGMAPYSGGWILHPNSPAPRRVEAGTSLSCTTVSPDGRWVSFDSGNVYEAATAKRVWQIPTGPGFCRFSPDGRWLLAGTSPGRAYAVGTIDGDTRFTPDGTRLISQARDGLRVWDLRHIRQELDKLGLDWDAPPYPAPPSDEPPIEEVIVDLGELGRPADPAPPRSAGTR